MEGTAMMNTLTTHVKISGNPGPIARSNAAPDVQGESRKRTFLAGICNKARDMWIIGSGAETFSKAAEQIGITLMVTMKSDESAYCRTQMEIYTLKGMARQLGYDETKGTEWIICPRMQDYEEDGTVTSWYGQEINRDTKNTQPGCRIG
jgi:hypothetical protein